MIFAQAVLSTMLALARVCPVCRRRQIVPSSRRRESVRCRGCGAQIPPVRRSGVDGRGDPRNR